MSKNDLSNKVFYLTDLNKETNPNKHYVQIKVTKFNFQEKKKDIIQIIDISASIMYDQQQAQNSFLSLVNACISHELRNPLNSIMA